MLSRNLVVPLEGSLAYLRVMRPQDGTPFWQRIRDSKEHENFGDGRRDQINFKHIPLGGRWEVPMWYHVSRGMLTLLNKALNIDQYDQYASTPVSQLPRPSRTISSFLTTSISGRSRSAIHQCPQSITVQNDNHDRRPTTDPDEHV